MVLWEGNIHVISNLRVEWVRINSQTKISIYDEQNLILVKTSSFYSPVKCSYQIVNYFIASNLPIITMRARYAERFAKMTLRTF